MTAEMHILIDDLTAFFRGRKWFSELSAAELATYSRQNKRLRQLCQEMEGLSL
jgi:hypothetical protein